MQASLSPSIATYFESANRGDNSLLKQCFVADATVKDEGQIHRGHDAIVAWQTEAQEKAKYSVEPLDVSRDTGQVVVTAQVAGNFPGGPVKLEHVFVLADDKIECLEIR